MLPGKNRLCNGIDMMMTRHTVVFYCQTSGLGLRLEVDFVFPLSQQEEQEEPSPKSTRTKCTSDLKFGT